MLAKIYYTPNDLQAKTVTPCGNKGYSTGVVAVPAARGFGPSQENPFLNA